MKIIKNINNIMNFFFYKTQNLNIQLYILSNITHNFMNNYENIIIRNEKN